MNSQESIIYGDQYDIVYTLGIQIEMLKKIINYESEYHEYQI